MSPYTEEQFWLATLAFVAARTALFNIMYRWQRAQTVEHWFQRRTKPWYNPVFFSFAVQHALANLSFLAAAIGCYLLSVDVMTVSETRFLAFFFNNIKAFIFQNFLFDILVWIRDHEQFSITFRNFYYPHHTIALLISLVWNFTGVFDELQGRLGMFTMLFLASSMTSDVGFFLRMFSERDSTIFQKTEVSMSILQRVWRWIVVGWGSIELVTGTLEASRAAFVVLGSGAVMECFGIALHVRRFLDNRKELDKASPQEHSDIGCSEVSDDTLPGDQARTDPIEGKYGTEMEAMKCQV